MESKMELWCLIGLTCLLVRSVIGACNFPGFLQTNGTLRDWRGKIKSEYTSFTLSINITDSVMKVTSSDSMLTSYEQRCVRELSDQRYMTEYREEGQRRPVFVCIQFLQRSDNVIQFRHSPTSDSLSNVCDGSQLELDPWIMIDKARIQQGTMVCPIVGGFGVKLFDNEYQTNICEAYENHVRLESECVSGEGMTFLYRYTTCVPSVMMSSTQRTACLASWSEGSYSYILLRHKTSQYMWLLRYPSTNADTSFVAHLMKDMYASTDPYLSDNNRYVKMYMVRDTSRPVTSLCVDEFEGCQYWEQDDNERTKLSCPRTFGLCNSTRPSLCSYDSAWHGDWEDAAHRDRTVVTFDSTLMSLHYNRQQEDFHCVLWDQPYTGPTIRHTSYKMLVTDFNNGCLPKYSCARYIHKAPMSAVMFLQLSEQRTWPFTNSIVTPVNCLNFDFQGDDNTLLPNRYRSKHFKLLYSSAMDQGTRCNIPVDNIRNFTVTLQDSTECSVDLQTRRPGTSFFLSLAGCSGVSDDNVDSLLPINHNCVESSRLFPSIELLLVTKSSAEPQQLYCWFFPKKPRHTFYLVDVAHCNENTKKRIAKGHLTPLATFSRYRVVTTTESPVLPSTTVSSDSTKWSEYPSSTPASGEKSVNGGTPGLNTTEVYRDNTSSKPDKTDPASYASPVVVVAAIIFFVIFQIPCMCKNS